MSAYINVHLLLSVFFCSVQLGVGGLLWDHTCALYLVSHCYSEFESWGIQNFCSFFAMGQRHVKVSCTCVLCKCGPSPHLYKISPLSIDFKIG